MTTPRRSERISKMEPAVYYEEKIPIAYYVDGMPIRASKTLLGRLKREMAEFDDPDIRNMFKEVSHIDDRSVALIDNNGVTWVVERSLNYFEAPHVYRNGKAILKKRYDWSPYLTSSRWLMMLMTQAN